jgi:hypothetical protein
MKREEQKERLRAAFLTKAAAVFEAALDRGAEAELTLSQMEETVEALKFELTSILVESMIKMQGTGLRGPGPQCAGCGGEMYSKGKKRRHVLTSQGEIELERSYHYCQQCRSGIFPPGSTTGAWSARLE